MSRNGEMCEQMVREDVMSPLSVMLKEVGSLCCFLEPPTCAGTLCLVCS